MYAGPSGDIMYFSISYLLFAFLCFPSLLPLWQGKQHKDCQNEGRCISRPAPPVFGLKKLSLSEGVMRRESGVQQGEEPWARVRLGSSEVPELHGKIPMQTKKYQGRKGCDWHRKATYSLSRTPHPCWYSNSKDSCSPIWAMETTEKGHTSMNKEHLSNDLGGLIPKNWTRGWLVSAEEEQRLPLPTPATWGPFSSCRHLFPRQDAL